MGIRAMLRAAVLLLLIKTWLAESNGPSPTAESHSEIPSTMPQVVLDLFNCKNCADKAVVRKILDRVLSKYDVRLRPNFGGDPVPVRISVFVSSIEQISETNMDYTITMFFHQTWKDSRLAYYETNLNLTLDYQMHKKLWVPDCYFLNSKDAFVHDVTVENRVFQLHPDGTVRYGIRLTTTAACSMDLHKFPMDKQACKLEVESYGYTVEDVVLSWEDNENAIYMTEELTIPQFSLLGRTITSKEVYFYTGSYMRLILKFQVQREVNSYLVQVYWPTVLTTILSWISFWMNFDSSAARVTIGLTSILVLTTIDSHMRDQLPNISCIKAIDIYILVCLFFVFLSLLEYVYINYLFFTRGPQHQRRRHRRPRRMIARYLYQEVAVGDVQPPEHQRLREEMALSETTSAMMGKTPPTSHPFMRIHLGNRKLMSLSIISSKDGLINMEDGACSLPTSPALACLASPESLSSLASTSEQAQLATLESLSPLSSLSGSAQLATGESLSDLPSTSEQTWDSYSIHFNDSHTDGCAVPTKICNRAEAHGYVETQEDQDSEESWSSDESHGQGLRGRPVARHSQMRAQEASLGLDDLDNLCVNIDIESNLHGLEEQLKYDADGVWSLNDDELMTYGQEKDSSSDSEDSRPPSPGCTFIEFFSLHLFKPDYVPKVDRWSRFLFPLSFGLFNVIYWLYHIF